jgi:uncharacterized membrane protein
VEEQTNLFGIPIPSTDKTFLMFVVVHIVISLVALTGGIVAMLANKTSVRHKRWGNIYFWSISLSFPIIIILSVMRWPHNIHLLSIGVLTFCATFVGRRLAKSGRMGWPRLHTVCMGMSYVLLLTGFYVDNGKNLPFWRMFPEWSFYLLPSFFGIPIILRVLKTHPLNKRNRESVQ